MEIGIVNTEIAKAEFIKLKPHSSKFYEIADTKGFLESEIKRLYTHLEKGAADYAVSSGTPFLFDVIETLPESVVSLNETDVEVDFEKAHDYVEPPPKLKIHIQTDEMPAAAAQEQQTNRENRVHPLLRKRTAPLDSLITPSQGAMLSFTFGNLSQKGTVFLHIIHLPATPFSDTVTPLFISISSKPCACDFFNISSLVILNSGNLKSLKASVQCASPHQGPCSASIYFF